MAGTVGCGAGSVSPARSEPARSAVPLEAPGTRQQPTATPSPESPDGFLLSSQLASGALASHPDKSFINPYLANLAVVGVATTCDPAHRAAALKYLRWYADHAEAGVVADHDVRAGREVSREDQDSQDAYAGTFLSAVAAMTSTATAAEAEELARLRPAVADSIRLLARLQDADGLLWAKPDWRVKYLMDQSEVYAGLRDIGPYLADDPGLQTRADTIADGVARGIQSMWDPATSLFAHAEHENGDVIAARLDRPFPDVLSQVWAVVSGVATDEQAAAIMRAIHAPLQQVSDPLSTWEVEGKPPEPIGYWPFVADAYRRVGMVAEAERYEHAMLSARHASDGAWPFSVATAGALIRLGEGKPLHEVACG